MRADSSTERCCHATRRIARYAACPAFCSLPALSDRRIALRRSPAGPCTRGQALRHCGTHFSNRIRHFTNDMQRSFSTTSCASSRWRPQPPTSIEGALLLARRRLGTGKEIGTVAARIAKYRGASCRRIAKQGRFWRFRRLGIGTEPAGLFGCCKIEPGPVEINGS